MFLSRYQIRECDRRAIEELGIPGIVLMENAGRASAEFLVTLGIAGPVAVCCGKGNNGGDGFVIARHLARLGVDVQVMLFARPDELSPDAAINFAPLPRLGIPVAHSLTALPAEASKAEWTVDALLGSGVSGPMRPPLDSIIAAINGRGTKVFAVDIPSGLDADSGQPLGSTIRAHHTATMLALKTGFTTAEAQNYLGHVHIIDIGVSLDWLL